MTGQLPSAPGARAWIEVDLGALVRNGAALARRAGARLLPMVKADGYGLGAVPVARALERLDPWGFGVATVDEGLELRRAGIARPIVVFTPLLASDLAEAASARLTPTLHRHDEIMNWGTCGLPWHLAIDTGMNRAGIRWTRVGELAEATRAFPPEGAFTHFHSADRNDGSVHEQEQRFREALEALPARPRLLHAENSAAIVRAESSQWDVVRPGVFLFGVGSGAGAAIQPEPVVSMRARVVDVRDVPDGETVSYSATYHAVGTRRIATVSVGYGDGYPRAVSGRASALIDSGRVLVAGLVTMDMTMLDVTGFACEIGDTVTMIGECGSRRVTIESLAADADMLPYELLTGLRGRLARTYADSSP